MIMVIFAFLPTLLEKQFFSLLHKWRNTNVGPFSRMRGTPRANFYFPRDESLNDLSPWESAVGSIEEIAARPFRLWNVLGNSCQKEKKNQKTKN